MLGWTRVTLVPIHGDDYRRSNTVQQTVWCGTSKETQACSHSDKELVDGAVAEVRLIVW
jgi:hypothetical protein